MAPVLQAALVSQLVEKEVELLVLYLSAKETVRVKVEKQVQEQWVQEQLSEERHH